MSTILNLFDIFEQAGNNNPFIGSTSVGENFRIYQNDNVIYPALWVELPTVSNAAKSPINKYAVNFVIADRVLEDWTNELEILSKTKQIGESVLKYIRDNYGNDYYTAYEYSCIPFTDAYTDRVTGWRFEIEIRLKEDINCKDVYNPTPDIDICENCATDVIDITVNNIELQWSNVELDYTIAPNEEIPSSIWVEWSDTVDFSNILSVSPAFTFAQNPGLLLDNPITYYARTNNGYTVSDTAMFTISLAAYARTNALSFDGVNDYYTLTNAAYMHPESDSFSLSFWVKRNALGTMNIIGNWDNRNTLWGCGFQITNTQFRFLAGRGNTGAFLDQQNVAFNSNINEWYHVVITRNRLAGGTNNQIQMYINANLVSTANFTIESQLMSSNWGWCFGATAWSQAVSFNGALSEWQFYRNVLTQSEVTHLYNAGLGNYPPLSALNELECRLSLSSLNTEQYPRPDIISESYPVTYVTAANVTSNPIVAY